MKRLIFLLLALLVAGSASAATKVQVMTDGKIDVDRLPTISFFQETDPSSPKLGQIWWNSATNQLKVAGALGVYAFNSTGLVEWDTTPAAFSFTDVANATTSTAYTSDPITVAGINHPAAISVSGDASAKYSINNATAVSTNGTVESGDEVRAVVTSSADAGTAVNATVTIGGVSDAYSVTTTAAGGVTYLIDEDFEGTGAPSGWTSSPSGTGAVDYDHATNQIAGTQSMRLYTTASGYISVVSPTFTGSASGNTLYVKYKTSFRDPGYNASLMALRNGATALAEIMVRSSDGVLGVKSGTATAYGSVVVSTATTYSFKLEYIPGTGSNAVARLSYYTGGSWVQIAVVTTGTQTLAADRMICLFPSVSTASESFYDDIAVE